MSYLAFCEHNHSCDHMHGSLESQMKDERCLLHSAETGRACCALPHGVDFLCMGTPCPPFSRQRPKRFASGTVKQHRDANTTFMHAGAFLEKYEPRVAVLEQVEGFIMPMAAGETDTPLTLWPCQALFFFFVVVRWETFPVPRSLDSDWERWLSQMTASIYPNLSDPFPMMFSLYHWHC